MFLISDFLFFIQKSTIPLLHFLAPYSAVLKYSFSTRLASAEYSESNPQMCIRDRFPSLRFW